MPKDVTIKFIKDDLDRSELMTFTTRRQSGASGLTKTHEATPTLHRHYLYNILFKGQNILLVGWNLN